MKSNPRKLAECKKVEEVQPLPERRRLFFENAKDGILILDAGNGQVVDVNPFLIELLGYSHDAFFGKQLWEIGLFKDTMGSKKAFLELLGKGYTHYEDLLLETADGRHIEVEFISNVYHLRDRKMIQCDIRDITKRKQAEVALQKKSYELGERVKELNCLIRISELNSTPKVSLEQILQGTVDLIPSAWQVPDLICTCLTINGQTFSTANFNETDWKQTSKIFLHDKHIGKLEVFYLQEQAANDEGPFLKEEQRLLDAIAEGIGKIVERKKAEEEKKKLQRLLQQSQKLEAMGTLAGGIAHDFNNFLTIILGHSELILTRMDKKDPLYGQMEAVSKAGNKAKSLVNQILTFSRSDKQEFIPLQLKSLIKEALDLLKSSLSSKIELKMNLQSDLMVLADPTQIHQVILNFCTNANHAMQEKGGILNVLLDEVELGSDFTAKHPGLKPGQYIRLSVADTGYGMHPEVLDKIFDPFFTTKKKSGGTGLGLSVVHGIIKRHKGTITVYSEPGKGSTFNVFLPAGNKNRFEKQGKKGTIKRKPSPFGGLSPRTSPRA